MSGQGDVGYSLVMPFVTVTSVGGPHDDGAYVAGYAMGRLDSALALKPVEHAVTVEIESTPQADLIAMNHGYAVTSTNSDDPHWVSLTFLLTETR